MRDGEYLLNIECCVTVFLNFMVFGGRLHQQRIFIHNLGLFAVVLMKMVCCFLFLLISWAGCLGKSTSFCRFFCATSFLAGVRTRRGRKELMCLVPVFGRILHFAPYFLLFFHCLSPPYILLRASTSLNLWSYPLSGRRSVARTELPNPNVFTIYIYVYICIYCFTVSLPSGFVYFFFPSALLPSTSRNSAPIRLWWLQQASRGHSVGVCLFCVSSKK